jgi:hypothetical protein
MTKVGKAKYKKQVALLKEENTSLRLRLQEFEDRLEQVEKTQRLHSQAQIVATPDVHVEFQKQESVVAQVQDFPVAAEPTISLASSNQLMAVKGNDTVDYEDDFDDCLSIGSMPINPLYLEKLKREKREVADQQRETVPQALVSQDEEENQVQAEAVASRVDVNTINNALTESRSIHVPVEAEVQREESAPEPIPLDFEESIWHDQYLKMALVKELYKRLPPKEDPNQSKYPELQEITIARQYAIQQLEEKKYRRACSMF